MICILLFISFFASAQNDTVNRFNEKGHKQGYWKKFLNDRVLSSDSMQASFIAYEVYDDDQKIISYNKPLFVNINHIVYSGHKPDPGKPEIINGTFKYYSKKQVLMLEESFKNGYMVYSKFYKKNRKTGELYIVEFYDFGRRYNNQVGSFYHELAFTPTNIVAYWFRKGEKRWKDHKITNLTKISAS